MACGRAGAIVPRRGPRLRDRGRCHGRQLVQCGAASAIVGRTREDRGDDRHRLRRGLCRLAARPEGWWEQAAGQIDWDRRWDRAFDPGLGGVWGEWFAGGVLNTCHNCLDRHVAAGRGEQAALIWDSAMENRVDPITYRALRDRVARLAGALAARGIGRGDRVVIYMPMIPSAVVAMLACARLGAIHSVVFGGFAAAELASRIADAKPRAILSASCGLEPGRVVAYKPLLDAAIALSPHKPEFCLIEQRAALRAELVAGRDEDFAEAEAAGAPHDCVPVAATDPLYIIYTSGTTGRPKGIVRDNGGHAVALVNSMRMVFGVGRRRHVLGGLRHRLGGRA